MKRTIKLPDGSEYDPADFDGGYTEWVELDHKMVKDSDGFETDYTLWYNEYTDKYVCIFGDRDVYYPENSEWDIECENEDEAREWFDSYTGFDDEDDIESAECIECSDLGATDVVDIMYNEFPKASFIEEAPDPDYPDKIQLKFDFTSWPADIGRCYDFWKDKGLRPHEDFFFSHYTFVIIVDEDETM